MVHRTRPASGAVARGAPGRVRIIGGLWKRRLIDVVEAPGLRPTPDRVRETLFNWLTHLLGGLHERSVLDLFAGSGALGFEAASRGASPVVLVDTSPQVLDALRRAKDALGAGQVEIRGGDALGMARTLARAGSRFDLVLVDPPFASDLGGAALALAEDLLSNEGLVYYESSQALRAETLVDSGLALLRADRAGDVFYHLLQRNKKNTKETVC